MRTLKLIVALALVMPTASFAQSLSYNYVDGAHFPKAEVDGDNVDVDGDGLQLRGSLQVYQNLFVFTEFADLDFDRNIDTTRILVGAGGHWPIVNNWDIIARAAIVHLEVDGPGFDDDDTGVLVGVRARGIVYPKVEVEGGVEHQRVEAAGLENDTFLVGEARYNFTSQLAAGVLFNVGGDTSLYGVHARYSF
ncbi:MAG TPA: outer membrane beta-barrel protein [Steroidobacteraceae bacterium]|nr:outer membrane beta-barrel protein [Steroidobacteraceae bacterium]